jgi:hypothetical protein
MGLDPASADDRTRIAVALRTEPYIVSNGGQTMKMKISIVAALFAIALATRALAQMAPGQADADYSNYLSKHPNEAAQIQANPRLIDNPTYIKNHPALAYFLDNHPNVRKTIRAQANGTMHGPGSAAYAGHGPGNYAARQQSHNAWWGEKNHSAAWHQRHPDVH